VSSVSSALSSSASKAASTASAAADAPTSELLRTVASQVQSIVKGELVSADFHGQARCLIDMGFRGVTRRAARPGSGG
jgi:hypothetical protein